MYKPAKFALALALGLSGLGIFGQGVFMGAKAIVAQRLMDSAWTKTAATGEVYLPWSWMDAHPVARLTLGDSKSSYIVLNTDSGQALAFGPAVVSGTENTDMLAIAAHKNTQFQGLKDLTAGDLITLERPKGETLTYRMIDSEILDSRSQGIEIATPAQIPSKLALVTCYPFDAISFNGPLRYVVYAEHIDLRKKA